MVVPDKNKGKTLLKVFKPTKIKPLAMITVKQYVNNSVTAEEIIG